MVLSLTLSVAAFAGTLIQGADKPRQSVSRVDLERFVEQHEVALRMWTNRSAVSRLESGRYARPTLDTIEKYALAVDARVEIRVRPGW